MRTLVLSLASLAILFLAAPSASSQDAVALRRANAAAKAQKQAVHQARIQQRQAQFEMWRRTQAAKRAQAAKAAKAQTGSHTRPAVRTSSRPAPALKSSRATTRPILRTSPSRATKHKAASKAQRGVRRSVKRSSGGR